MKVTKSYIRQLVKEELYKTLNESYNSKSESKEIDDINAYRRELNKQLEPKGDSMDDIRSKLRKYTSPIKKRAKLDPNAKPTFNENDLYDGTSNFPLQLWNACAELGNKDRGGNPVYSGKEILFAVMDFLKKNDMTTQQLEVEYKKMEAYMRSMVSEESTSVYGRYDPEREQKVLKDIEGAREVFEQVVYDAIGDITPNQIKMYNTPRKSN